MGVFPESQESSLCRLCPSYLGPGFRRASSCRRQAREEPSFMPSTVCVQWCARLCAGDTCVSAPGRTPAMDPNLRDLSPLDLCAQMSLGILKQHQQPARLCPMFLHTLPISVERASLLSAQARNNVLIALTLLRSAYLIRQQVPLSPRNLSTLCRSPYPHTRPERSSLM